MGGFFYNINITNINLRFFLLKILILLKQIVGFSWKRQLWFSDVGVSMKASIHWKLFSLYEQT